MYIEIKSNNAQDRKIGIWKTHIFQIQQCPSMLVSSEDGGSMFNRNVGVYLGVHIRLQPTDQYRHSHRYENI